MRVKRVAYVLAVVLQLVPAPVAMASPPLPSVDALSPGIGLATFAADLSEGDTCTAGFLVRDRSNRAGLLSAGHCDRGGTVAIKLAGADYTRVGAFDGGLGRADIGFVALMPGVPVNPLVAGAGPVTGATDHVTKDEVLCKMGFATGSQCGPVTDVTANTVSFAADTQCGDSGGPVYAVNPNGSVTAVGITVAGTMGEGTVAPHCGSVLTYAIAQLIQPWLHGAGMSVLTS